MALAIAPYDDNGYSWVLPCYGCLDNVLLQVTFEKNAVFAELFLNKDNFLGTIDNKIASGIQRAFLHSGHVLLAFI